MIYGFMDESGTPGVLKYNGECFLVSLVLFDSEEQRDKSRDSIEKLRERLHLPEDYEFHCHSNSAKPQTEFLKLLSALDFRFITVAIHKNSHKKTASYSRIADLLVTEIEKRFPEMKIEMDSNPMLHAEIRKELKSRKLKNIRVCERNSRHSRFIQMADYVASISAKKVKNTKKSQEQYKVISKKVLSFIEVAD